MKRLALLFCVSLAISAFAGGCGESKGSDNEAPSLSGFYSLREPDSGGGPATFLRYASSAVSTVKSMDFSGLTTTQLPTFNMVSSGAAVDVAGKAVYGVGRITDSNTEKSVLFKVEAATGAASLVTLEGAYGLSEPFVHSGGLYAIAVDPANDGKYLVRYPLTGGAGSTPVPVDLGGLYAGAAVRIVPGSAPLDAASGKLYLLLRRDTGGQNEYSVARVDVATGAVEDKFELGSGYAFGNLFLNGADLFLTAEEESNVTTTIVKVAKTQTGSPTPTLVSTVDFTPVRDATHTEAHVARYTLAFDGARILVPLRLVDNTGGSDVNVLATVDVASGKVTKLDTVIGCYFLNAFVP